MQDYCGRPPGTGDCVFQVLCRHPHTSSFVIPCHGRLSLSSGRRCLRPASRRRILARRGSPRVPQVGARGPITTEARSSLCWAVLGLSSETSSHRTWSSAQHWWKLPFEALRRSRHRARREAPPQQRGLQLPRGETEGRRALRGRGRRGRRTLPLQPALYQSDPTKIGY